MTFHFFHFCFTFYCDFIRFNIDETFDVEFPFWFCCWFDDWWWSQWECWRNRLWWHFWILFMHYWRWDTKILLMINREWRWWCVVRNIDNLWMSNLRWWMIEIIWWGEKSVHVRQRGKLLIQIILIWFAELETFSTTQKTSICEHVKSLWMKCPIWAFSRTIRTTRNFDKTIIKTKIVS